MRYCFSCGEKLLDGASFCSHCGKEQVAVPSAEKVKKFSGKGLLSGDWRFWTVLGVSILSVHTAYNIFIGSNGVNKNSNLMSDNERNIFSDFRNLGTLTIGNAFQPYDFAVKNLTEVPPQFLRGIPSGRSYSVRVVENKISFRPNDSKYSNHEGYFMLVQLGNDETDVYCYTTSELLMKACFNYKNKGR